MSSARFQVAQESKRGKIGDLEQKLLCSVVGDVKRSGFGLMNYVVSEFVQSAHRQKAGDQLAQALQS